jgi:hypothetical protein
MKAANTFNKLSAVCWSLYGSHLNVINDAQNNMGYEDEAACENLLPSFDIFVGCHEITIVMISFTVFLSL